MNSNPTVTVLMPIFNAFPFLREAIESVLSQSYSNFELLLIDDGSTDQSQDIIGSYRDQRVVAIHHTNVGVARTLNRGLALARGELIWRHDADDISQPTQLEAQVNFLQAHPEIALVGTQIAYLTERGKVSSFHHPKDDFFAGEAWRTVTAKEIIRYRPLVHATMLIRRVVLQSVGGYRPEFRTSEDFDLWLRLVEQHQLAVLNQCPYYVRLNATSSCRRNHSTLRYFLTTAETLANERRQSGQDRLQRGELVEPPVSTPAEVSASGALYRDDLAFPYRVSLDARDWLTAITLMFWSIRDGWRLRRTWRMILFPLMGESLITQLVHVKHRLQRRFTS